MIEHPFEEMKRYVRLGPEESQLLVRFGVAATPSFPRIVDDFYDRVREHEEAHAVLSGEAQISRLQGAMLDWLRRLVRGTYDEVYFAETAKIGHAHVRVGLPQRYMFTSMALIRAALMDIADREMGADAAGVRRALGTLLDLELGIMLESYRENLVARIQHVERLEKEELGRSLARAEHRYQSAVELARVIIIGLDARGQIRLFNREAERVIGLDRDEATGRSFVDLLIPEESRARESVRLAEALANLGPQALAFDGLISTRSGRVRMVRWQLAYSPSDADDDVVLIAVGHDTTEENAQAERTRQHEKLAAVGTLAAGLAHEIRNPLNGAQLHVAYLERALRRDDARPDLREAVSVVGDEIKRLATLVTEFLDFARPKPLLRQAITLRTLCERTIDLVTSEAAAEHVALHTDAPLADVTLYGDPNKLEQVLLNLLRNAIEATANGSGTAVTLRARRQPRHVVFEVEDDGPGLVKNDAPIFDAFFSTKPSGTGLGLAITHRIVSDHGGTIAVESRPGRTVFFVKIPMDDSLDSTMGSHGGGTT